MTTTTPQLGECDFCGQAHFTKDCPLAASATIDRVKQHKPIVREWECETCGPHQDWECQCGWKQEMATGWDWHAHLVDVLEHPDSKRVVGE